EQQQSQPPMQSSSYQAHQQQQDQYYDHNPRPKAFEKPYKNNARNNRRDANGQQQQRTPYSRPPPNPSTPKICFYCSVPGHTVQQCSLKTMHVAQRKRQQHQA
ncbi:hypothetical protein Gpo141_00014690, partial [Globisporangium polare]